MAAREQPKGRGTATTLLYAESLGEEVRWTTKEEEDEVAVKFSTARGYLIESFLCNNVALARSPCS